MVPRPPGLLRSLALQGLKAERTAALRRWVLHIVIAAGAVAAAVASIAAVLPMVGDPEVIVDARSDAVAFVPASNLEIVRLIRPRHGLHADRTPFVGIRFQSPLPADSVPVALGGADPDAAGSAAPRFASVLQFLEVTPGCLVRIERLVAGWIRLGILPVGDDEPCRIFGELFWETGAGGELAEFGGDIDASHPLNLNFQPSEPLTFQRFTVARLGFESQESGEWRSSILDGLVRLPEFGDDERRLYLADGLTLGSLEGEVVTLAVGDSIRTLYRGTAEGPAISGRSIQPTLLRQLLHSDGFQIGLAVAFGLVTLIAAILQAVLA